MDLCSGNTKEQEFQREQKLEFKWAAIHPKIENDNIFHHYYIFIEKMINMLRKIVSGPKNRTKWKDYDFDLTQITDRVIAMAFPASGIETTYRNSIKEVAKYLQKNHPSYLIINASNRKYDYEVFNNQVKDYFWIDHRAPPLSTLFEICTDMYEFLKKDEKNVVCVHCNHGKGRTGTAIISFILYVGFYMNAQEALKFYNKKRFSDESYGVHRSCQIRYLQYVQEVILLNRQKSFILEKSLKVYRLMGIQKLGLTNDYYITISLVRTQEKIHKKIQLNQKGKITEEQPLIGDIFIQLYKDKWNSDKRVSRMNVNLFFLEKHPEDDKTYILRIDGSQVHVSSDHHRQFALMLYFEEFCKCQNEENQKCPCIKDRVRENFYWKEMIKNIKKTEDIKGIEACKLIYFPQSLDSEEK